jgi:hypothetical protein
MTPRGAYGALVERFNRLTRSVSQRGTFAWCWESAFEQAEAIAHDALRVLREQVEQSHTLLADADDVQTVHSFLTRTQSGLCAAQDGTWLVLDQADAVLYAGTLRTIANTLRADDRRRADRDAFRGYMARQ